MSPKDWMPPYPEFDGYSLDRATFNRWYAKHIEPLFENAKVVYGAGTDPDTAAWSQKIFFEELDSLVGLLIGIREFKEDSADELLQEVLERVHWGGQPGLGERIRAYLAKRGKT